MEDGKEVQLLLIRWISYHVCVLEFDERIATIFFVIEEIRYYISDQLLIDSMAYHAPIIEFQSLPTFASLAEIPATPD
jgi:hypothetical protein